MIDLTEYEYVEKVKARPLSVEGEQILTTTHGPLTVFGGYLVYHSDGRMEYCDAEKFEAKFREVGKVSDDELGAKRRPPAKKV